MPKGYVIGHEPMGIVEEVGPEVTKVKKGDRVVVPFNVACGHCFYCEHGMTSQCDNSNEYYDSGGTSALEKSTETIQEVKLNI